MKFKIWQEQGKEPADEPVMLRLVPTSGGMQVQVVDEYGERVIAGSLVTFWDDGTLTISSSVNPELGFKLDKAGRIKLED